MATIAKATRRTPAGGNNEVHVTTWAALTTTNADGEALALPSAADRSVQVTGTFGAGGSVRIQGSNDNGVTWAVLTDPQGNDLNITAAKIERITELTELIRPLVTAGDGTTSLTVHILTRRVL
ncbi:MAG: hypothetical protein FJ189_00470 [Gammaproteobacteria bacterium]|nr:hypothetical protein [Gammaproteobacteria bacterium]